jgi:hypothetical protein
MKYIVFALVLVLAASAFGLEKRAYQMREDFGIEPEYDGALQFYYYIPCSTYSWFWAYSGWLPGDIVGQCFPIGQQGTGGWDRLDPYNCNHLEQIRVLDFAGYGTYYPGLFTINFDVWCCICEPIHIHIHLWSSGPWETSFGWNYIPVPLIWWCDCDWVINPYQNGPVIVVTATHTGTMGNYPAWGLDNISTPIATGCELHDIGCIPVSWPRPPAGSGPGSGCVHGGYFGTDPMTCPPQSLPDGRDTTPDGTQFGYLEFAWRIYVTCLGPTSADPSTWGDIKSMYR